jgi:uncharacterized protein YecE (DUF72 family)
MPTVLQLCGSRIVIYTNDHRPAHVHAIGNGAEAVFRLHCPNGLPELRENYGFSRRELNQLLNGLAQHAALLCAKWRHYHGNY